MKISAARLTGVFLATFLCGSVVAQQSNEPEAQWRKLDQDNTVLLRLPHGPVVIELTPQFAPNHVSQIKKLIRKGHYDGSHFYRVIDGFVAQGGPQSENDEDGAPQLKMEALWSTKQPFSFTPVQTGDMFTPLTGLSDGFPIGQDPEKHQAWLLHCPGVFAMARGNEPDTGSDQFYIPIGQAPRYLDKIMTIMGRVVYGMDKVQAITRTAVIEGDEAVDPSAYTLMISMQLMSDVADDEKILLEVEDTQSAHYRDYLEKRRHRESPFFYQPPPPVLDICQVPVRTRRIN